MKLIIDIPDKVYGLLKYFKDAMGLADEKEDKNDNVKTALIRAVINGTPLDDVKAEIDYERNRYLNLVGDSGYCNGLNKALKIIDNIGKAESEDFPQAKDIEPTVKGFVDTMDILDRICEESEE